MKVGAGCHPNKVKVSGPGVSKTGLKAFEPTYFTVDCTEAGQGTTDREHEQMGLNSEESHKPILYLLKHWFLKSFTSEPKLKCRTLQGPIKYTSEQSRLLAHSWTRHPLPTHHLRNPALKDPPVTGPCAGFVVKATGIQKIRGFPA